MVFSFLSFCIIINLVSKLLLTIIFCLGVVRPAPYSHHKSLTWTGKSQALYRKITVLKEWFFCFKFCSDISKWYLQNRNDWYT